MRGQAGTALALLLMAAAPLGASSAAGAPAEPERLPLGRLALLGSDLDHLEVGLGAFEAFDEEPAAQGSVEYRIGSKIAFIGPALGLLANVDGGVYGYFGLYLDLAVGPLTLTPMLAAGGYHEGSSEDLGGVFQFRQSLALTWRFDNGHRLGIKLGHISNADINDTNPGAEDLMITYALPLGPSF